MSANEINLPNETQQAETPTVVVVSNSSNDRPLNRREAIRRVQSEVTPPIILGPPAYSTRR
jgi:hypothetical protein